MEPNSLEQAEQDAETRFQVMPLAQAQALAADPLAAPEKRLRACEELVQRAATRLAVPALRELERLPHMTSKARRLMAVVRFVERAQHWLDFGGERPSEGRWQTLDGSPPGESTASSGALLWVRSDTRKTVLAFSTYAGGFGPMRGWSSVFLTHRFLAELPVNVVYLRDETYCLNLAGNDALGAGYAACLDSLRNIARSHRWSGLYTLGLSMGGYSALRFGLDLGARAALSFSGPTSLASSEFRATIGLQWLHEKAPDMTVDLLPLYRQARRRPRLLLCYGEHHPIDADMASRMGEFAETELVPFPGFKGHSTFMEAGRLGQLRTLAARLTELPQ